MCRQCYLRRSSTNVTEFHSSFFNHVGCPKNLERNCWTKYESNPRSAHRRFANRNHIFPPIDVIFIINTGLQSWRWTDYNSVSRSRGADEPRGWNSRKTCERTLIVPELLQTKGPPLLGTSIPPPLRHHSLRYPAPFLPLVHENVGVKKKEKRTTRVSEGEAENVQG